MSLPEWTGITPTKYRHSMTDAFNFKDGIDNLVHNTSPVTDFVCFAMVDKASLTVDERARRNLRNCLLLDRAGGLLPFLLTSRSSLCFTELLSRSTGFSSVTSDFPLKA
jgi:hypothetical protein